ncbi:hypothetical protein C8R46DRAFT_93138 [Mycena filopes]|nr:hypothetical protein C8R46DRAFT_93138 [Mycena filopes]
MTEEKMFYGDGRAGESPHDFKKKVQARFMGKGMSDAEKVEALGLGMASGSPADTWFDDPARTAAKASWALMSAAFDAKWPKRAALKRVGQDAIDDLLAEKLKVEDIGKRMKHGGVEEFGHVVWARNVARIAADIPDATGLFIGIVVEKLPLIMQELLVPGTVFADWSAFETAVAGIKVAAIVHAKAKETRLVEMAAVKTTPRHMVTASHQPAPVHPQRPSFPSYPYPSYPPPQFTLPPQQPVAFAPPPQPAPPGNQAAPAQRPFRPDHERLVDLERNLPVHHPATDAGRAAYAQLISDWDARNGARQPNELRPYPLTPGTAPLEGGGECFNCALFGHMTNDCPNPSMPAQEKKWRQIAASIRNGARGIPRRNTQSAPAPIPIQYVAAPYNHDPNPYPYHPWYSQYAPQYQVPDYGAHDQGNGQGSSN